MVKVLFLSMGEDYHVVQVDQGIRQVKFSEAVLHEPLECRWGVTEPVWHSQKLIHSHTTHHKSGVLLGVLSHLDLPEARFQVHCREEPGTYHWLHGLLHTGKGVSIFLSLAILPVEINTKPETPIVSKYGLSSCSFSDRMSLVDHMQISIGNGNSPRLWLDAYHTPLISVAPGFSWQCDLGRWRSLEPCFALCAKII